MRSPEERTRTPLPAHCRSLKLEPQHLRTAPLFGARVLSRKIYLLGAIVLALLLAPWVYGLPFVQDRVAWRVSELRAQIKYAISPPEEAVFTPNSTLSAMVDATLAAIMTPTPNALPRPPRRSAIRS